jgi:opacity protein-like surface antigen
MMTMKSAAAILLMAASPALAQYVSTPDPGQSTPPLSAPAVPDSPVITAKQGQSQDKQWSDRYDCHRWAVTQSNFDPTVRAPDGRQPPNGRDQYRRAFAACMEGRGYGVSYEAAAAPAAPPPSPSPSYPARSGDGLRTPTLHYHPFDIQLGGGYSITTGTTSDFLNGGPNLNLGFTWYPTASLPIGIRVNGSYNRFTARNALLDAGGANYTHGYENIYGGDLDLQLDLSNRSSRYKLYLFGGASQYREQVRLRQISYEFGVFCGFFYCRRGFGPVLTAEERATSPWRPGWNAGLGWEVALHDDASFFLEARYLRIAPRESGLQFVPVTLGVRF